MQPTITVPFVARDRLVILRKVISRPSISSIKLISTPCAKTVKGEGRAVSVDEKGEVVASTGQSHTVKFSIIYSMKKGKKVLKAMKILDFY